MKTEAEWRERALELLDNARQGHNMECRIVGPSAARSVESAVVSVALAFGREMATEARADERERIAREIQRIECAERSDGGELLRVQVSMRDQCARIALYLDKPKTREDVLEEALRAIEAMIPDARPTARRALEWKPE